MGKYEKPLKGTSHAMGLVIDKQDNNCKIPAKQPNSGLRKGVRVQLNKNKKIVLAFVPKDGGYNLIENKEEVLVAGMGRSGRSVGDLSKGVCHKVVKGIKWRKRKNRPNFTFNKLKPV